MSFSIVGTGSALPQTIVHNNDLTEFFDTSNAWIKSRTGISSRYICTDESILDLALAASQKALKNANIAKEALDYIICPTLGGDMITPSLSCQIQEALAINCPCFDLNAACSGFVYGLDVADAYFRRKPDLKILVIAVDAMSKLVDWNDRSTAVLFGDGAGAVVLSKGNDLKSIYLSASGNTQALSIPWEKGNYPLLKKEDSLPFLKMDGAEVYRFAVAAICQDLKIITDLAHLGLDDLDLIIPHQANRRIIEGAVKRLKIPLEKFAMQLEKVGNTSAASIPLLLDELNQEGKLKAGMTIALTAFGGGLTTGACVLEWSKK